MTNERDSNIDLRVSPASENGQDRKGAESTFESLFRDFCGKAPETTKRLIKDLWSLSDSFTEDHKGLVIRALIIAAVSHQFNRREDKRIRKADNSPYINHPLEMAVRLAKEGFDWLTVSTALLHDVPEDSDLGKGLCTKKDWIEALRNVFNAAGEKTKIKVGINLDRNAGDLLVELLDGVNEEKLSGRDIRELWSEEFMNYEDKSLFKMIEGFMEKGGVKSKRGRKMQVQEISMSDRNQLISVIYNLERLFDFALKSPDHWRIFLIKIADVWHNFQSPEYIQPVKILRGKIAAGLAEWMGWYGMRSEIIEMLSKVTDTTTVYAPQIDGIKPQAKEWNLIALESEYEVILHNLRNKDKNLKPISAIVGWPLVNSGDYGVDIERRWAGGSLLENSSQEDESSLPVPEAVFIMPDDKFIKKYEDYTGFRIRYPDSGTLKGYSTTLFTRRKTTVSALSGHFERKRLEYTVKVGNGQAVLCRFEDGGKPYLIDIFKGKNVKPEDVPEAGLFNEVLRKNSREWAYHLEKLTAFLYDFNLPFAHGKEAESTRAVSYKGNLLFLDANTRLRGLLLKFMENVPDTAERYSLWSEQSQSCLTLSFLRFLTFRPGRLFSGNFIGIN